MGACAACRHSQIDESNMDTGLYKNLVISPSDPELISKQVKAVKSAKQPNNKLQTMLKNYGDFKMNSIHLFQNK